MSADRDQIEYELGQLRELAKKRGESLAVYMRAGTLGVTAWAQP